jgi:glutathione peroxidase
MRQTLFGSLVRLFATFAAAMLWTGAAQAASECPALLNHTFNPLIGGKPVSLCQYSGRVLLVVNTASNCGYTGQYEGLEKLSRKYRDRGLTVVGFPSNDFGAQEPGSNQQIAEFCKANFGVSFPMFEKLVQPIPKLPLYDQLIAASRTAPRWNFHKYLIDRKGAVTSFDSNVEPEGREMTAAIERALAAR